MRNWAVLINGKVRKNRCSASALNSFFAMAARHAPIRNSLIVNLAL